MATREEYRGQGFEKLILKYLAENYKEEIWDGNLKCIDMYYYSRDLSKKENY